MRIPKPPLHNFGSQHVGSLSRIPPRGKPPRRLRRQIWHCPSQPWLSDSIAAACARQHACLYADDVAVAAAQLVETGRRIFLAFDTAAPAVGMAIKSPRRRLPSRVARCRLGPVTTVVDRASGAGCLGGGGAPPRSAARARPRPGRGARKGWGSRAVLRRSSGRSPLGATAHTPQRDHRVPDCRSAPRTRSSEPRKRLLRRLRRPRGQ